MPRTVGRSLRPSRPSFTRCWPRFGFLPSLASNADFVSKAGHVTPNDLSPPLSGYPVNTRDGSTKDFGDKDHEPSAFELNFGVGGDFTFGSGDEIDFRFLMSTQIPLLDMPPELVWELNSVQVKGGVLCAEPGGIGRATVGVLAGLGWRMRRRLTPRAM